jgi:RNA polymerase sigma-70 factor (ECF subfamily)
MTAGSQDGMAPTDLSQPGERELIQRIRAGEKELFHTLIRPHERSMYGVIHAVLPNPADAEEAAQEAAFKAYLHLDQLADDERFKAWLLRVALNEARMRRRKDRPHLYDALEGDLDADEEGDFRPKQFADWRDLPSEVLDREELRIAVREAVLRLPDKYRVIFLLADAQGLSYEEIAAALDISIANVKTRLHRARMKLQEQLTPVFKPRISDHLLLLKGMNPWSRARK